MHCLACAAPAARAPGRRVGGGGGRRRMAIECAAASSFTRDGEETDPRSMMETYGEMSTLALGDPSVKIDDVTPKIFPSGPLFPTEIPEGNGSGVVWDDSGHIVTNYHVVGNALSKKPKPGEVVARVNILAADGIQKNFEGKLVGADRSKDLAVLKVDAPTDLLKPINVGQSSALRVGQQCLAIGNPFGFDHTLTVGVISGLNRDIFSQAGVTIGGGIQTDAAINPGNSGGPLLDSKGHMIGINTAIFTQTGTSAGVGFAIPSSTVLKIAPQLIQFGKVRRAGLNVEFAPDPIAYQLNVRTGALILQVPGGSAAAKAGLVPTSRGFAGNIVLGDIIVAVDGKPIKGKSDLSRVLDDYGVGDKVSLTFQRGAETLETHNPLLFLPNYWVYMQMHNTMSQPATQQESPSSIK
uniref:PDZ domain-containing protein n=1 Tax=Oryza meridionalis TaxID=40149 RepID=A0A0E0DF33_9ORYZ